MSPPRWPTDRRLPQGTLTLLLLTVAPPVSVPVIELFLKR